MRTVLTIGREADNDLVINLPIVSGHHARVTWEGTPGQALIEDLGSSNGTSIGQIDRKITRSTLSASDTVYFGNHPVAGSDLLAWVDPSLAPTLMLQGAEMVVGRDPSCQRVIDRSTISGRHARLRKTGDRIILEDLGSSNGTFVNGRRVEGPTEVRPGDLIGLGADTFRLSTGPAKVAGTMRIEALKPDISHKPAPTLQMGGAPTAPFQTAPAPAVSPFGPPLVLLALLAQAPLLAIAIGLISGNNNATALFLLSLAAVWLGLSTAVFGVTLDPDRPEGGPSAEDSGFWLSRSLTLGTLCLAGCVLAVLVALPMAGTKGPVVTALGLSILAAGVGLGVGSLIVLLSPSPPVAWGGLAAVVVGLCLFGGGPWSLPRSAPVVRIVSNAAPSRWAFEGLLVSEPPGPLTVGASDATKGADPTQDLAEDYFPAQTDRMGARADAMALASMLFGLLGLSVFLVKFSGTDR